MTQPTTSRDVAEVFGWREGIGESFRRGGTELCQRECGPGAVWVAVINGVLAPFLLTGILLAASDRSLMLGQPTSRLGIAFVGITTVAMFGAAAAMFLLGLRG